MYRNPEHYADPTAGQAIQKPLPFRSSSGKATVPARKTPVKTAVMSEKQIRRIEKERLDKLLLPCPFCGSSAEITTCPQRSRHVRTIQMRSRQLAVRPAEHEWERFSELIPPREP